jgi:hypothetical protein
MAKITLNGIDALTESGGTVTVAAGTNLVLGTGAVPTAAIQDDAITGAKIENNPTIAGNLTVAGTLTVEGVTSTIESVTLTVDDKNIELGSVDTPSDTTADGGGITLKGATDKTILYEKDTKSWDFNQKIITRSGEAYMKSLHRSWVMGG